MEPGTIRPLAKLEPGAGNPLVEHVRGRHGGGYMPKYRLIESDQDILDVIVHVEPDEDAIDT